MSALQKMLGIGNIDFESIGAEIQRGVQDYNRKLDAILANQERLLQGQAQMLEALVAMQFAERMAAADLSPMEFMV